MDEHGGEWDPAAGAQKVAQRRERRYLLLVIGLAAVGGLVGAAVVAANGGLVMNDRLVLVLVLAVALLVVSGGIGLAFVWWRRRSGSAMFARSPLWELPYRQRTRLVKALRRGGPIPPEVRPLAVRAARDIVRRRGVIWLYLGLAVLQTGNFFLQDGWARWFALAAAPCFLAGAGYFAWLRNRMRDALVRLES